MRVAHGPREDIIPGTVVKNHELAPIQDGSSTCDFEKSLRIYRFGYRRPEKAGHDPNNGINGIKTRYDTSNKRPRVGNFVITTRSRQAP
jgi:hypothetical protein